jgi:2-polyprenyl-3-methyl-5-hydroxy-6-metoxy-1,4-benzoquinol methylase
MILSEITPQCIVCNNKATRIRWSSKYRTIWTCDNCGLLFVFPPPNAETMHTSFQKEYFVSSASAASRLDLEFDAWRRPALEQISNIVKVQKNGGRLLDVGCAGGALFEFFCDNRWTLYGVEPSQMAYERAKARFDGTSNVTLLNAYLRDAVLPEGGFDVITVLEALYYMPDPQRDLRAIQQLLKPDGLLVIEFPSFQYQRLWRTGIVSYVLHRDWCTLTQSHISYFSDRSLSVLLAHSGIKIVKRIPMPSSAYGASLRRFAQRAYFAGTRILFYASLQNLNLAPRTLYLCKR